MRGLQPSSYEPVSARADSFGSSSPETPGGARRPKVELLPCAVYSAGGGGGETPASVTWRRSHTYGVLLVTAVVACIAAAVFSGHVGPLRRSSVSRSDTLLLVQDSMALEICKFVPMSYGSNGCPWGLHELTLEECQASPDSFAGRLHDPLVLESKYFPRGCFQCSSDAGCQGNPIYFNSHPSGGEFPGRRPLCKSCEPGAARQQAGRDPDEPDRHSPKLGRPWNDEPERHDKTGHTQACADNDDGVVEALREVGQAFGDCGEAATLCVESLVSALVQLHCPVTCGRCSAGDEDSKTSSTTSTSTTLTRPTTSSTSKAPTTAPSTVTLRASASRATTSRSSVATGAPEKESGGAKSGGGAVGRARGGGSGHEPCAIEEDTDYIGEDLGVSISGITSAELCRTVCQVNPKCGAWTWGQKRKAPGLTDTCFLKKQPEGESYKKLKKAGVVSGLPCQVGWDANPLNTMFCWALTQPDGYEPKLLEKQSKAGVSIFACDEYSIYSNQVFNVGDVVTSVVHHNITAVYGGEFMTALNTKIFAAVWDKVIQEGRFEYHSWTVKVDPDSVFLPERLRGILKHYSERPNGVYVNNCKYGLHGPVEVFSKNAVRAWGADSNRCFVELYKGCNGECAWGEDLFIDQCLWKVLRVEREDNFDILQEDHCDPPEGWRNCTDPTKASFHPFKEAKSYFKCLKAARSVDAAKSAAHVARVHVLQ